MAFVPTQSFTLNDVIHNLAAIYPFVCDNLVRIVLLLVVDMYSSTLLYKCGVVQNIRPELTDIAEILRIYRSMNASIGPILLCTTSLGLVILTSVTFLLSALGRADFAVYIVITMLLLYNLASRSHTCYDALQSLKPLLR